MRYLFPITFVLIFLCSCDFLNPSKKLYGEWQCVSWTSEGKQTDYDVAHTFFNFKDNDTYTGSIDNGPQKGSFYVEDGYLYTTADGDSRIMTKIEKIVPDTLHLSLNRSGTIEEMIFIKK